MGRHREQADCRCGLPAYALSLCHACYRYTRRTGERRTVSAEITEERLFSRRENRIIRELEAEVVRGILA